MMWREQYLPGLSTWDDPRVTPIDAFYVDNMRGNLSHPDFRPEAEYFIRFAIRHPGMA
jgi:hypothetical protein